MDTLMQFLTHTPVWVWVLLVYLFWRGMKGLKPAETSLVKLAVIPVIFTVWGIYGIAVHYGVSVASLLPSLLGLAVGTAVGWWLLRHLRITVDPATGRLHRPADRTLLPLLMVTFVVKYGFEATLAVNPTMAQVDGFRIAHLLLSGVFTGIFIGKFLRYARARSQQARAV